MNNEQLKQANSLQKQIEAVENQIHNAKSDKWEWIMFSYGNGSCRDTVCNNLEDLAIVKTVLISLNEKRLADLKAEFENL